MHIRNAPCVPGVFFVRAKPETVTCDSMLLAVRDRKPAERIETCFFAGEAIGGWLTGETLKRSHYSEFSGVCMVANDPGESDI